MSKKFKTFKEASRFIRAKYSSEQINEFWNNAGLGKLAKVATTNRWLKKGPDTKNVRFEPYIAAWAESEFLTSDTLAEIAAELDVTRERVRQLQRKLSRSEQLIKRSA